MKVWLVESGDYEQRAVFLVAKSFDAALTEIKAAYGPPYVVRWEDDPVATDRWPSLIGNFSQVPGYSTQHRASFDLTEWDVVDSALPLPDAKEPTGG